MPDALAQGSRGAFPAWFPDNPGGLPPGQSKSFFRSAVPAGTISQPCSPNVGSSFIRFVSLRFPLYKGKTKGDE